MGNTYFRSFYHLLAGTLYEMAGIDEKAIHHYSEAVFTAPQKSYLYLRIGHLQYKNGHIHEAAHSFRQAAKTTNEGEFSLNIKAKSPTENYRVNRSASKNLIAKGIMYYQQRYYKEALSCFKTVLDFNHSNHEALEFTGLCMCILKEYDSALPVLAKLSKINSKNLYNAVIKPLSEKMMTNKPVTVQDKAVLNNAITLLDNLGQGYSALSTKSLDLNSGEAQSYFLSIQGTIRDIQKLTLRQRECK